MYDVVLCTLRGERFWSCRLIKVLLETIKLDPDLGKSLADLHCNFPSIETIKVPSARASRLQAIKLAGVTHIVANRAHQEWV